LCEILCEIKLNGVQEKTTFSKKEKSEKQGIESEKIFPRTIA